ncbi:hypothetical protein Vretimale_17618 [Volvox reticuliferus]|uniref:Uncharacterized protein n=1 Tax=Volvox reticuliferus TaxID=1737510 RepID=A0A8J4GTA2_9CHLO|nr:hypothetical protein Vretimale_17618 [Volvox reticuliferus]
MLSCLANLETPTCGGETCSRRSAACEREMSGIVPGQVAAAGNQQPSDGPSGAPGLENQELRNQDEPHSAKSAHVSSCFDVGVGGVVSGSSGDCNGAAGATCLQLPRPNPFGATGASSLLAASINLEFRPGLGLRL